jgi:hypothetical protein
MNGLKRINRIKGMNTKSFTNGYDFHPSSKYLWPASTSLTSKQPSTTGAKKTHRQMAWLCLAS